MTRSYRWLLLAIAAATVALGLLARAPKSAPQREVAATPPRAESLALEIRNGAVHPGRTAVMKGAAVTLAVRNRDEVPRRLALAGYEDRWTSDPIAPREVRIVRFRAERPGADFPWLVDGMPAGTFTVAGSHLEEGHR